MQVKLFYCKGEIHVYDSIDVAVSSCKEQTKSWVKLIQLIQLHVISYSKIKSKKKNAHVCTNDNIKMLREQAFTGQYN